MDASFETAGSLHDSSAWRVSPLHAVLDEFGLPCGFWIAGDEAYVGTGHLLIPFGKKTGKIKGYLQLLPK